MATRTRKRLTRAQKDKAIAYSNRHGCKAAAGRFGVSLNTIYQIRSAAKRANPATPATVTNPAPANQVSTVTELRMLEQDLLAQVTTAQTNLEAVRFTIGLLNG